MPPSKSFSCSFQSCDKIFTKASDLRKHEVNHTHPEKIFKCTNCDFTTLQRKNLKIHSTRHTGEKPLQCPQTVIWIDSSSSSESSVIEQQCPFKTNDPAALTRHRKSLHGYVPSRRRRAPDNVKMPSLVVGATTVPSAAPHVQTVSRRVSFLVPADGNDSGSDSGYSTPEPPHSPPALTWVGDVNVYRGETSESDSSDLHLTRTSTCRFLTMSSRDHAINPQKPVDPCFGFGLDTLHAEDDNESYMVEIERIRPDLEMEIHEEDIFNLKTGREGCLCPKWMIEAGIEGWDASVLELHKDYYSLGSA